MKLSQEYFDHFAEWTRLLDDQKIAEADQLYFDAILPAILPVIRIRSGLSQSCSLFFILRRPRNIWTQS